jgi:CubicO group peptidase (beta-lactamase class C family)
MIQPFVAVLRVLLAGGLLAVASCAAPRGEYIPPAGAWEGRDPADLGIDPARLAQAVEWAKGQETDMPRDFSTQAQIFGRPLGPVAKTRARTNGVIVRHGHIAARWGDVEAVDPTYSVAKSYLSAIAGVTLARGRIGGVHERVGERVRDGGYDPPHNAKVTWVHHLTQTSEWQGEMWGKPHTFIGREEFGRGEMKPREPAEPGSRFEYNDVRINRLALSLLRVWGKPLPDVLRDEVMDPIGASDTWRYPGYDNSKVEVGGRLVESVSGGTRWGGGLWMSTLDHARFGLLFLRRGRWGDRQVLPEEWVREATSPQGRHPEYGYLWWLNTRGRWEGVPAESFAASGAGDNTIWVDPEHDLVIVWRWHKGGRVPGEFFRRVLAAIKATDDHSGSTSIASP